MTELAVAPNPFQAWLDAAAADPAQAGPPPSTADLIEQLAADNPRLAGVMRYLTLAGHAEADDIGDEPEPEPPRPDFGPLRTAVRRLHAEVEELRARNDELAAALGACHLCWGEDSTCIRCHGRGRPGALRPDPAAFAAWILPAVRRAAPARRATPPGTTTPTTTTATTEGAHQ